MKSIYILIISVLILLNGVLAQDIPPRPSPPRLVNDLADILTDGQERELEETLRQFNNTTTTQIVVVTVKSLNGYDKADFTFKIGETWGVGQKGFNNGVVLMVKPKYSNEKGETFIATGYGLEGIIPDAISKRIVENEMIPHFKNNDMYGGIKAATKVLMSLAAKEFTPKEYNGRSKDNFPIGMLFFIGFVIFMMVFLKFAQARAYSAYHDTSFWTALMLVMLANRRHPGKWREFNSGTGGFGASNWGGSSSGSSWGGSSGGSSFGGFGGGSFGGGGAGGSW